MAECNLGKVKLEPMLTAAVCGSHVRGGGSVHLQALLQGPLDCIPAVFSLFACLACHS